MAAIGDFINKADHDIYLLQELWMRPDHNTIRRRIPAGWFMTTVREMGNFHPDEFKCDGEYFIGVFPSSNSSTLNYFPVFVRQIEMVAYFL